jgi:integrase
MAKINGLQRRGLTFYVRVRVPQDLLSSYKTKEVIRSLETRDFTAACKRIHKQRAIIQSEFDEKRYQKKAAANNPDMLSDHSGHELEEITLRWLADVEKRIKIKAASNKGERSDPDSEEDILLTLEQDASHARREMLGLSDDEIHYGMDSAAKFLKKRGITFDHKSKAFKQLGNLFSKATYAMAQHSLRQWKGEPYAPADPLFAKHIGGGVAYTDPKIKRKVTVKELFAEYMKDPTTVRGLSTQKNYQIILRALEEQLGSDKYVHEITQEDAEQIRDLLLRSPTNAKKMAPGKTLEEAADLAPVHGWSLLSRATVNVHLSKLNAVMRYATRKKYTLENPATNLLLAEKEKKKDKRKPFDTEQLKAIFAAPLYTGCVNDERGYDKVGKNRPRGARFWVPLIALYTGMRLNEICQLEIADVIEQDNVDVILIREESDDEGAEKQVKTEAGIRYIPVHPELKKMGLLEYVANMKKAGHTARTLQLNRLLLARSYSVF